MNYTELYVIITPACTECSGPSKKCVFCTKNITGANKGRSHMTGVRTGHGNPGKSWNFKKWFSKPGKSWNSDAGSGKS